MYDCQTAANRIKMVAKLRGVLLRDMLSSLGLGINIISHLSKGQVINSGALFDIAECLDCSVDFLLGRTDNISVNK